MAGPLSPWLTSAMIVCRRAVPSRLRAHVRRWMFDWLDLTWPTRSGLHLRVGTYDEWIVYNEVFVSGDYDHALAVALDAPRDGTATFHVVDVGAHVGYFTLRAVDRLRHHGVPLESLDIIAFEASEAFAGTYESYVIAENGLGSRVRLVRGLVGERRGAAAFDDDRIAGGPGGRRVPYVDLSSELARVPRIDVLKCDIEGAEQRLIENYPDVLGKTRVAVFELHRDWCDIDRCRALLREYGFTHAAVVRDGERFSVLTVWR